MRLGLLGSVLSSHILGMTRTRLGGSVSPALLMAPGEEFLLQSIPAQALISLSIPRFFPALFDLGPSIINLAATRRRRHGDIPIPVRHQAVPAALSKDALERPRSFRKASARKYGDCRKRVPMTRT